MIAIAFTPTHPLTTTHPRSSSTVMATSAMKVMPRAPHLDKFNHCRDMMSFPAPSKKPTCADHQKGGCKRSHCPYFHPPNPVSCLWAIPWLQLMFLVQVVDKPSRPARQKVTPATTKQPKEPTPNPPKPPTEPTPKVSGPKPPQPSKNDKKSVRSFVFTLTSCHLPHHSFYPSRSPLPLSQSDRNRKPLP